jgi:hypothetical protein
LSDVLYSGDIKIFKIAIIADPDQSSKSGDNEWTSFLRLALFNIDLMDFYGHYLALLYYNF